MLLEGADVSEQTDDKGERLMTGGGQPEAAGVHQVGTALGRAVLAQEGGDAALPGRRQRLPTDSQRDHIRASLQDLTVIPKVHCRFTMIIVLKLPRVEEGSEYCPWEQRACLAPDSSKMTESKKINYDVEGCDRPPGHLFLHLWEL